MTTTSHVQPRWIVCVCVLTVTFAAAGCRDSDPGFEVITLQGKVEKIEVKPDGTGEITVLYFSEKHDQEMLGTGTVTKNTEIMINGVIAQLKDIREGERVRGEVRIDKKGSKKERIALKIYIDRAQPVSGGAG